DAFRRYKETRCLWPSLRHPNIVFPRKTTFDNSNQRCFLEMEFCEIDLLDLVKRDGPLSEARGALFAGHLAAGLAHCHSLGIAHQDIKLENVFLRHGVAKLGDFGSIRQNALGKGAGSFDHAAAAAVAEVTTAAQSWGYDSFASDVWSLGILLYAAVAGCLPW
ncbi:unnamed protein product, partial [Sphacelaria rigidula]